MILAGDVGGTKTLLGLFRPGRPRPVPAVVCEYPTLDFESLDGLLDAFTQDVGPAAVEAICLGIAGSIDGLVAEMVNVPWAADASRLGARFGGAPVTVLNDLEAMAHAVPVLETGELHTLQPGIAAPAGNVALIAAGTGLGEALLHHVGGRFLISPTEAGHADFAARTPRELAFAAELTARLGRVDLERVLSGQGLVNLFKFTHGQDDARAACPVLGPAVDLHDLPAVISSAALDQRCARCAEALEMFVEAYGAEAGNLALRFLATGGVYVGGGIAPRILAALERGPFMAAFRAKAPMTHVLERTPVHVILNAAAGLLGAAVAAEA